MRGNVLGRGADRWKKSGRPGRRRRGREQVFPGRRDDAVPRISLCCRSRPALSVSGVASVLGQARMAEWLPLQRPSSPRVENSEE